jgi:hypothetical protein
VISPQPTGILLPQAYSRHGDDLHHYLQAVETLRTWIEQRNYAGYEPYDLLNSPYLQREILRSGWIAPWFIQAGRRFGGSSLRRWLKVPRSKNPKALGLCVSAYCDLAGAGIGCGDRLFLLKDELRNLRSPREPLFCWGYDWDFVSFRGTRMPKFSPNCIATCFVANAFLDMAETHGDAGALAMAQSAGEFIITRLNRAVDSPQEVCFSYTPHDRTRIYNSSGIAGALLARLSTTCEWPQASELAQRSMRYIAGQQLPNGSWTYGASPIQNWIDGFHTGYNLCALSLYRRYTGDLSFESNLESGYRFYKENLVCENGAAKALDRRVFPIDIHACSQAILTFCEFQERDPEALPLAQKTAQWALQNMRSEDGSFFYQRHRTWVDRTPYMRWGQAWMFTALAKLHKLLLRTRLGPSSAATVTETSRLRAGA